MNSSRRRISAASRPLNRSSKPVPDVEAAFRALLVSVQQAMAPRLERLFRAEARLARPHGPEFGALLHSVRDLTLRGGKRLRPALLAAGFRAVSNNRSLELALRAGSALELLQSYFLIHDDWMDGDLQRRGGPSVHAVLRERFADTHKGDAAAILAGDYAAALAWKELSRVPGTHAWAPLLFDQFAAMQASVITGQTLDVVGEGYDIETMYALKTGAYTVGGPLELGAIIGGGTSAARQRLARFARPLGVAFQLRDDLLGVFGDPAQTGKAIGSDLKAGKRTLLVAEALERARGAERRDLERVLGNARAPKTQLVRAITVLDSCGARKWVEARISTLTRAALRALRAPLKPVGVELLHGAALALTARGR